MILFGILVCFLLSLFIATEEHKKGRFFWRTFLLGFLGFLGAFGMLYKYISHF
jgi:hypothetical protein